MSEATQATWYEAARVESPERPRLTVDLDVDVCVVGAGLAGLTAAREIAKRGWSVAVLEANRIGGAASGRNTGFVLPGFAEDIDSMVERIGLDHTKQLWALSERGLAYVKETIEETKMPGVTMVPGWLHVSKTDQGEEIPFLVERMRWIGANVEAWNTEQVREILPSPQYFNAVHYPAAFHINPLNYTLGLAAAAEEAGVRIFEGTPAVSIDVAGVRKRITVPGGRVRAGHVVLAGNVNLGRLMPRLAATLLPISTYVLVTEPIPNLGETIKYVGAVSDTEWADNHYRIVGGDRLQWSGRMTVWEAQPKLFARGLIGDIKRNFPALGDVQVANIWCGTLGRAVHRMPQIGEIERGVWVASGFGGHGLNTTAMAGELIARGLVENDETWRLFAPYELVWAGGVFGRVAAQGLYWGTRPIEMAKQKLARYRETALKRKAERLAQQHAEQLAAVAEIAEHDPAMVEASHAPHPGTPDVEFVPAHAPKHRRRAKPRPKPRGKPTSRKH
jgi:glycine/D-amino acid oxidase-like deaminating enzyme